MNVGTAAAIKGAVSTDDLRQIKTQVELSNTYHLHVRPGDEIVKKLGGLHRFMNWDKPILTDSGGFQVFSLASLRKIKEEGVHFHSHIDGRKIFMGPEESMQIQSNLASTIAMAFDECPSSVADKKYMANSVARTTRWLKRCKVEMARLNSLRIRSISISFSSVSIREAFTRISVSSTHSRSGNLIWTDMPSEGLLSERVMKRCIGFWMLLFRSSPGQADLSDGVGTPANILEAVDRGVDFFDCVYPSRNGRHGHVYTNHGKMNLFNAKYELDDRPIEEGCGCPACRSYSRAYIRHLLKAKEMLGMRLCVLHNLYFYNTMKEEIRDAIDAGEFSAYKRRKLEKLSQKS